MERNVYEMEHAARVRTLAPECTVLLRTNGAFPLSETGEIALFGSGARHTVRGGTGSGEVNTRSDTTVEQGLTAAGFSITSSAWLDAYDRIIERAYQEFLEELRIRARKNRTLPVLESMGETMREPEYMLALEGGGETAVYVLARNSGEGADRKLEKGDVLLTDTEVRDILALQKRYKQFLLVLNVGGAIDLSPLDDVENILLLSQLGSETGHVLADLLLGKAYPSGKLTTTWPTAKDCRRIGQFADVDDTCYTEGVYVGYRFFDSVGVRAPFPFGFGLGYTTFDITPCGVLVDGETILVRADVQNAGARAGKEVVQLYCSVPGERIDAPYQGLAAWQKTRELAPGERQTVTLSFPMHAIASFDETRGVYFLEAGAYVLRIGASSVDTAACGVVRLEREVVTKAVRLLPGTPKTPDWKPQARRIEPIPEGLPVVSVDPQAIRTESVLYTKRSKPRLYAERLSNEELTRLHVGAFSGLGAWSVVGSAAQTVAGAAGETTSSLKGRGIAPLVMADGPAGLRLARTYIQTGNGTRSLEPPLPESMLALLAPWQRKLLKRITKPKVSAGDTVYEQAATALPIGTAIAQSWNLDTAQACGDIVGAEMERFGVHLWLAPALNIHRDIRCGRNFEYFSEDPLLSGCFAAALTRGVQAHPGCGATIKHFAANNQETNRCGNNSVVSERALREIYFKGFEICIRSASPAAVMTSYNLINGTHTSESRALMDVLRCEWGFDGIVMTDWLVLGGTFGVKTRHRPPHPARIVAAGSSLIMPGTKSDQKSLLAALKNGTLTREQLIENASYTVSIIQRLAPRI